MEAVCFGVPAPFLPNTSVSAVTDSHPFGGGNAGGNVTGAVMIGGEVVYFDADDYKLWAGDRAVVLDPRGNICVVTLESNHPEELRSLHRTRRALMQWHDPIDGRQSKFAVQVLGRHVPVGVGAEARQVALA